MIFYIIFFLLTVADAKLVFVNVVHRHGDRTPEYLFPKDPYQYWKEGLGVITNLGKREMYELGEFMRSRYSDFLPSKYNESDIHVEASSRSRTLASAYCSLAALYKPEGDDVWSDIVKNWQPIPVYSIPKSLDNKIRPKRSCTRYNQLRKIAFETEISEEKKTQYKSILKKLSKHTGLDLDYNLEDLRKAAYVFDTLFVEKSNKLELPKWASDFYPLPLGELGHFIYFLFPIVTPEMRRFQCGPLLKDMVEHFEEKIKGSITEKWWQYSGHDLTIINVLKCLNVYDGVRPVYASVVFLELHQNANNNYDVAVVYRKNESVIQNLKMPGCEFHCPLEKFRSLIKDLLPNNWDEECKLDIEKFALVQGEFKATGRSGVNQFSAFSVTSVLTFSIFAQALSAKI